MPTDVRKKLCNLYEAMCSSFTCLWNERREKPQKDRLGRRHYMIFRGSIDNLIKVGGLVLEQSISLFHGRTNPIRYFSVDDLNTMCVEQHTLEDGIFNLHNGSWEGRDVLVKLLRDHGTLECSWLLREMVVATQMATHNNVHKLLGCCFETESPVLVYEGKLPETLQDCILFKDNKELPVLDWKDRLRIAWEISHAVAYLHTAFPRPIVHKDLTPRNVFLDQDNAAKLSGFSLSVSIPEGEEYVEEEFLSGSYSYLPPEYLTRMRVAESTDTYAFGVLFLVLLTGRKSMFTSRKNGFNNTTLVDWVWEVLKGKYIGEIVANPTITTSCDGKRKILFDEWMSICLTDECIDEILDPVISRCGVSTNVHLQQQFRASIKLALWCTSLKEEVRPTMVDVATELKNISSSS